MYHVVWITRLQTTFCVFTKLYNSRVLRRSFACALCHILLSLSFSLSLYLLSRVALFSRYARRIFFPPRPALRINVFNAIWMGVLWMNTTGNRLVLFAQGENESVLMGERRALSWRSNGSRDDHSVRLCGCDYLTCFCMRVLAQVRSATVCRFTPCYSFARLL